MNGITIFEIDMQMSINNFRSEMNSSIINYEDGNINMSVKELSTKNGKETYKFIFDYPGSSNSFQLVFEKDPESADVILKCSQYTNMNGSFYMETFNQNTIYHANDDIGSAVVEAIYLIANKYNGTFVAITSNNYIYSVINGVNTNTSKLCVDVDGKVYGAKNGATFVSETMPFMNFNYTIKDWISKKRAEDTTFATSMNSCKTIQEQMDVLGKYLIIKKSKDEIEPEEFSDVFRQAGLLGFSDQTLLRIYKLFV